LCEIAIAACDLAEVIGSAIAINLLFGIPLTVGIIITILDVLILLMLQNRGFRYLEAFVAGLIFVIFCCFTYELMMSKPVIADVMKGLLPTVEIVTNDKMLFIAIGILGATVMPHNLYLHSSIVQTRNFERTDEGKKEAIKFATIDSTVSLLLAFFINAAILILAASAFHYNGQKDVADINDAYKLLEPALGTKIASTFFAIALLASGQNSTLTGTLAGQIVMEGFINFKIKPWQRRLLTRLIAVIPALIVAIIYGEKGTGELLVLSQVILSVQLSFAVVPLLQFTGNKTKMSQFVNGKILHTTAWIIALVIISLNAVMLWNEFTG
jgi:manganese transport protein